MFVRTPFQSSQSVLCGTLKNASGLVPEIFVRLI